MEKRKKQSKRVEGWKKEEERNDGMEDVFILPSKAVCRSASRRSRATTSIVFILRPSGSSIARGRSGLARHHHHHSHRHFLSLSFSPSVSLSLSLSLSLCFFLSSFLPFFLFLFLFSICQTRRLTSGNPPLLSPDLPGNLTFERSTLLNGPRGRIDALERE